MWKPNTIYAYFDSALQPLQMNDRTNIYQCIFDVPVILAGEIFDDIVLANDPEEVKEIARKQFPKFLSSGHEVKQVHCIGEGISIDDPDRDYQRRVRVTRTDDPTLIPLNEIIVPLDMQHYGNDA